MFVLFILRYGESLYRLGPVEIKFGGSGSKFCQDSKHGRSAPGKLRLKSDVQIDGRETAVLLMDNRCSG
jgi:hypothetical protein